MTASDQTPTEVYKSITGFDEIAISKHFGETIEALAAQDEKGRTLRPTMLGRALAFVHRRRAGDKDPQAYAHVMNLSVTDVEDYFVTEPAVVGDEDDDEGKAPAA